MIAIGREFLGQRIIAAHRAVIDSINKQCASFGITRPTDNEGRFGRARARADFHGTGRRSKCVARYLHRIRGTICRFVTAGRVDRDSMRSRGKNNTIERARASHSSLINAVERPPTRLGVALNVHREQRR